MFEVLVYLYETYYRPDAFPEPVALTKTLSDIGFNETEIADALDWLSDLAETTETLADHRPQTAGALFAHRVFVEQELSILGTGAIGFIQSLENAGILDPFLREIVIERSLAANISPMPIDKLRLIVLVILWSRGEDPDTTLFNPVFADPADRNECLLH